MSRVTATARAVTALGILLWSGCAASSAANPAAKYDRVNAFELLKAAAAAPLAEDAGFLFFAGQIRFEIDKQVFPPIGTGGDSPATLQSALSMSVGTRVGPVVKNDARVQAKVAQLLGQWKP